MKYDQQTAYLAKEAYSKLKSRGYPTKMIVEQLYADPRLGLADKGLVRSGDVAQDDAALQTYWTGAGITGGTGVEPLAAGKIEDMQTQAGIQSLKQLAAETGVPMVGSGIAGAFGGPPAAAAAYGTLGALTRAFTRPEMSVGENILRGGTDAASMMLGTKMGQVGADVAGKISPGLQSVGRFVGGGFGTIAPEFAKEAVSEQPPMTALEKTAMFVLGGSAELFSQWLASGKPDLSKTEAGAKALRELGLNPDDFAAMLDKNSVNRLKTLARDETTLSMLRPHIDGLEQKLLAKLGTGKPITPSDVKSMHALKSWKNAMADVIAGQSKNIDADIAAAMKAADLDPAAAQIIGDTLEEVQGNALEAVLKAKRGLGFKTAADLAGMDEAQLRGFAANSKEAQNAALAAMGKAKEGADKAWRQGFDAIKDAPVSAPDTAIIDRLENLVDQASAQVTSLDGVKGQLKNALKQIKNKMVAGEATAGDFALIRQDLRKLPLPAADRRNLQRILSESLDEIDSAITDAAGKKLGAQYKQGNATYAEYARNRDLLEGSIGSSSMPKPFVDAGETLLKRTGEGRALEPTYKYLGLESPEKKLALGKFFDAVDQGQDVGSAVSLLRTKFADNKVALRQIDEYADRLARGMGVVEEISKGQGITRVIFPGKSGTTEEIARRQLAQKQLFEFLDKQSPANRNKLESMIANDILEAARGTVEVGGRQIPAGINKVALNDAMRLNPEVFNRTNAGRFLRALGEENLSGKELARNAKLLSGLDGKDMPAIAQALSNSEKFNPKDLADSFYDVAREIIKTGGERGKQNLRDLRSAFIGSLGTNKAGVFDLGQFAERLSAFNLDQLAAILGSRELAQNVINVRTVAAALSPNIKKLMNISAEQTLSKWRRNFSIATGLAMLSATKVPKPVMLGYVAMAGEFPAFMGSLVINGGSFFASSLETLAKSAPQSVQEISDFFGGEQRNGTQEIR